MRNPIRVLENLHEHAQNEQYRFERLYRNLYNPQFYLLAYQNLYANKGSLTADVDGKTLNGVNLKRIETLINKLKDHSYKPLPARRQYIPKKSGNGLRPLGIPGADDKLVQEVVRMLLESIFEPNFEETSHGFRPNRSCHTALAQVKNTFKGTKWFVEGDIKGFFDNIDHHVLVNILRKRIKDEAFIGLIWKLLRAGYMEQWAKHQTYSGTPQGSGVSPLLANIYLNELDRYVKAYKEDFDSGQKRTHNKEYIRLSTLCGYHQRKLTERWAKLSDEERRLAQEKIKGLKESYQSLPCGDPMDGQFKRIQYVRYADDFLIGVIGSHADAERVKADLSRFLATELKLTLSPEKTLITHANKKARFLGYDITISKDQSVYKTARGKIRPFYGCVNLLVPKEAWVGKLLEYGILDINIGPDGKERWMPIARNGFVNKDLIEILSLYNAEIRGIYNYYRLARNVSVLNKFSYVMEYSMYKTFARKLRTSIAKVKRKYMADGVFGVNYVTKSGETRRATFYNGGFKQNTRLLINKVDLIPDYKVDIKSQDIIARFMLGVCELCNCKEQPVTINQVKKVKDLTGQTEWEQYMIRKHRKTIVLCEDCYNKYFNV